MEEISGGGDTTKNTMASLGILCEKDIDEQRLQIDSFIASPFQRSMDSVLARAKATAQSQVELANVKADLREAEDELVDVLAVKTRKEAKQMGLRDSISATQSRIQVVKRTLQLHKSNKEGHSKTISHRLQGLSVSKDNAGKVTGNKSNIDEAISWYNQALGFHVEAGHGVKFTFTNIDPKRPTREFSFTVHYGNDIYTLLDCNPQLDDMVQELNKTNDLFGFVRLMRDKFQKATLSELPAHSENLSQETSIISASAPAMSITTDTSMLTPENKVSKVQVNLRQKRSSNSPLQSPAPTSSTRRSSRLKAKE
ncbi:PREDICTED: probable kinetochore protein SPC25 isoform X2 [Brassica oleracea var. oleracea]|uniref:probable kinetochore protein SPC25 isoform X2 n=1 Tax=Brassica oleracea var. oleracea TaxID=109376 RepID=UPI0006A7127C|nr:PREDICTED: probable kinetochore protein SPC25 isoform X2 [Brassica oleracea var. oleracea]